MVSRQPAAVSDRSRFPLPFSLTQLAEVRAIDRLAARFPRHPAQLNVPHGADAELIPFGDTTLAITVDALGAEWQAGIYRDAYTLGWTAVHASLSDLAAVGAAPVGLLLALTLPPGFAGLDRLEAGIAEGLAAAGVPVLGGDLNDGPVSLAGCAVGKVDGRIVTRLGVRPGDILVASRRLGAGNALATVRLLGLPDALWPEERFRPRAELARGQAWRPHVRALIDSSDGLMSALDHLARLNGVGIALDFDPIRLADAAAVAAFQAAGLPLWPLLAGEHGEYALVAAVAAADVEAFIAADPGAVLLGEATAAPGILVCLPDGRRETYDGAFIRNLPDRCGDDWVAYAQAFRAFGAGLGLP